MPGEPFVFGVFERLGGGDERVAKMRRIPARCGFAEAPGREWRASGEVRLPPLLEGDEAIHHVIKCEERDLIGGAGPAQMLLHLFKRVRPERAAPHARARIHQQDDVFAGAVELVVVDGALDEGPGEAEGKQAEYEAAQQQQKNVF